MAGGARCVIKVVAGFSGSRREEMLRSRRGKLWILILPLYLFAGRAGSDCWKPFDGFCRDASAMSSIR